MGEMGSVEIVIKGGRPWGFTLQGGAESRSAVTVAQIEPRGKADLQGSLKVGDHVLKINDVQCFSLADATQLIDCAFRTLTVHIWRSKSAVSVPNNVARENYRNNNSKNHHRQRHTEDDTYIRRISSPVNSVYHASYSNLPMMCKDIPQTPNLMSPCHSHQSSHEWVQYDRREMSPLETVAHSSQDGSVHSLATDTSVASSATIPQDHYEVSDSCNRHLRSPRNLTKDSGYETCAQTEHDYVNLEWLANSPFPKRNTPVVSPQGYPMTTNADLYSSNERLLSHQGRHVVLSSSSLTSEKYSYQSSSTGSISFPYNDYTDPCAPLRNISTPSSKYSESYNNLYSSTESLSSRASKPDSIHLRSSKSSLSLVHDSRSHAYEHQQVLTSCQYSFVSPAQSTPNLNYYDKMVPRRTNKKPSIYEELASKSGFDFSPMIQHHRLPFQKAIAKEEETLGDSYLPYANKLSADSFASFPENCDKINAHSLYRHHSESFQNESQIFQKNKVPASIPPPVPARDSSLRYRATTAHEKFPSWPVAVPVEMEINYSSVHSSGYRSSSWTEQTDCVKDFDGSYSRPKDNFQISTQHLHPVQERSQKSTNNPIIPPKNSLLTKHSNQYSDKEDSTSFDMCFNMLSKHLDSESSYQKCEKYVNDHSPPERDTITPVPLQNEEDYIDKYDNQYFEQSSNLYENVRRNGSHYHSTTPLLDRLRLERKGLPDSCPSYRDLEPKSETGTYVSSNSSSQETLKRHNSFSDLSSVHTFTRNDSPSLESETYSTYDENFNRGFKKNNSLTHSTECVPPSKISVQSNKTKYPWPNSNTVPYAVTDIMCERKVATTSIAEIEKIQQESKYNKRNLLFGDASYHHNSVTESENSKEKTSLPSYLRTRNSPSELKNLESKVIKPSHLYSSVQNEKKVNANNTTVAQSPQNVHCDKAARHTGEQSQYRRTNSVPESLTARYVSNNRHHYHRQHQEPLVVYSKNDNTENSENGNKFNQDLKILQKQAVLSFYHRQTTMASKDFAEKKSRSSSFSHSRETSIEQSSMPVSPPPPPPITQRRRVQASSSFSQPPSQVSACKSTPVSPNYENVTREIQFGRRMKFQEKPTLKTTFSSQAEKYSNEQRDSSPVSTPVIIKEEEPQNPRKSDVATEVHTQIAPLAQECRSETSDKRIAVKLPQEQASGRKALLQKTYSSNKSAVVKVISCDGETLAQNVITKNAGKSVSKPQVPPKRIHNAISVPPALPDSSLVGHNVPMENSEEEELLNIEMCHIVLPPKGTSYSPDLPLPPPPQNIGCGILNEDYAFPPPPDPLDISFQESECLPQYSNPNVSINVMEGENTQLCSLPLDVSKMISDVSVSQDQEAKNPNSPIKTSPIEKCSERLPLQSNVKILSSIPVKYELNTLIDVSENEAIYVNLPFQLDTCKKPTISSVSTPFADVTSSITVTNIGTQTSEATPLLQRKCKISYLANEYEDKEYIVSSVKEQIKDSMPFEKIQSPILMSYNTNEICTDKKIKPSPKNDIDNFNVNSCTSIDVLIDKSSKPLSDKVSLPVTCPYFTTSEPKAKLLTRYYHSLHSNWMDHSNIKGQKDDLVASISKKLNVMRLEQIKIREEMEQNEDLGKDIRMKIEKLAKPSEIEKYRVHVDESEKIVHILLSLSGRLTRAENALHILPKEEQSEEKSMLEAKKSKLSQQLDEALQLKENIDRRSCQVSLFLNNYLSKEDYADYEHFIQMKPKLLVDSKEIDDNIKLGEEQLSALHGTFQENYVNRELVNTNGDLTVLNEQ